MSILTPSEINNDHRLVVASQSRRSVQISTAKPTLPTCDGARCGGVSNFTKHHHGILLPASSIACGISSASSVVFPNDDQVQTMNSQDLWSPTHINIYIYMYVHCIYFLLLHIDMSTMSVSLMSVRDAFMNSGVLPTVYSVRYV